MNASLELSPPPSPLFDNWLYQDIYLLMEHMYPDWPYHNIEHALDTFDRAMTFVEEHKAHGIEVDGEVIGAAALIHDSLFHLPLEGTPFATKEERSAFVAGYIMPEYGFSEERVELTKRCIMATHKEGVCESNEELITVRADMGNVYDQRLVFLKDFIHVSREVVQSMTPEKFQLLLLQRQLLPTLIDGSSEVIGQYIFKRDLRFEWERDQAVECRFIAETRNNLAWLRDVGEQALHGLIDQYATVSDN